MPDLTTASAPPLPLVRHHREGGDELIERVACLIEEFMADYDSDGVCSMASALAQLVIPLVVQAQRPTRIEHALLRGGEDEWEMRQPRIYVKRQDEDLDEFIERAGAVWWDPFALVSREVGPWTVITPPRVAPFIPAVSR